MVLLNLIPFCLPITTIYLPADVVETNRIPIVRKDNNNVFILFCFIDVHNKITMILFHSKVMRFQVIIALV